jgi:hypothetical protein
VKKDTCTCLNCEAAAAAAAIVSHPQTVSNSPAILEHLANEVPGIDWTAVMALGIQPDDEEDRVEAERVLNAAKCPFCKNELSPNDGYALNQTRNRHQRRNN